MHCPLLPNGRTMESCWRPTDPLDAWPNSMFLVAFPGQVINFPSYQRCVHMEEVHFSLRHNECARWIGLRSPPGVPRPSGSELWMLVLKAF